MSFTRLISCSTPPDDKGHLLVRVASFDRVDLLQSFKNRGANFYYILSILAQYEAEILDSVIFCRSKFFAWGFLKSNWVMNGR